MRRGNSGQIRVLEAFLATAVVFSALLLTGPIYIVLENNGGTWTVDRSEQLDRAF